MSVFAGVGEPPGVAAVAQEWGLTLGEPYELSYHWVVPATRSDGQAAVLKVGVPVPPSSGQLSPAWPLACEARALQHFAGRGAVRLLQADLGRGALLLERADPGERLAAQVSRDDVTATRTLVRVMQQLHAAPDENAVAGSSSGTGLPALADERETFTSYLEEYPDADTDDPLPHELVVCGDRLFADLLASAPPDVVLHGDLHHDNLLSATREPWLAIDPHGFVGDPGYDVGAIFYNPDPPDRDPALLALLEPRIEQVADLTGMDAERVAAWAFVKAMLSELWTWEDDGEVGQRSLDVARLLYPRVC